jgi:hypothetical protein
MIPPDQEHRFPVHTPAQTFASKKHDNTSIVTGLKENIYVNTTGWYY